MNESEDEKLLGLTATSHLGDGDIKEMRQIPRFQRNTRIGNFRLK